MDILTIFTGKMTYTAKIPNKGGVLFSYKQQACLVVTWPRFRDWPLFRGASIMKFPRYSGQFYIEIYGKLLSLLLVTVKVIKLGKCSELFGGQQDTGVLLFSVCHIKAYSLHELCCDR